MKKFKLLFCALILLLGSCSVKNYLNLDEKELVEDEKEDSEKKLDEDEKEEYPLYTIYGTTLYFGSYPQSEVTDSSLKSALSSKYGTLPTSSNFNGWTDYEYYADGSKQSYMWYKDISYGDDKYRAVYFTSYRPYYGGYSSSAGNSYQDDNGYSLSTVYYFKYEPIEWTILSNDGKEVFVVANIALDSQSYDYDGSYNNNYANSTISAWLNDIFYNTAFSDDEQRLIKTTTVDNGVASTGYSTNQYACENTNDKIFLLSYKEVTNSSYGFSSAYNNYDTARQKKSTDYAKVQGCWKSTSSSYLGNCYWWLRSPFFSNDSNARYVDDDGYVGYDDYVDYCYGGVVPAFHINLE